MESSDTGHTRAHTQLDYASRFRANHVGMPARWHFSMACRIDGGGDDFWPVTWLTLGVAGFGDHNLADLLTNWLNPDEPT